MEIMKKVDAKGKNLVYSPLSIYSALGLLTFGAKGETLNQLLRFLRSENLDHLNAFCSEVTRSLNETQTCSNSQGFKLSCVNSVWVEQSCVLNPRYRELASSTFKAVVEAMDFIFKANEARLVVNQWVEQKTSGLIKDLIPEGYVNSDTAIILVNALYFKGSWCQGQFDKGLTRNSEFYSLDGSCVQVPFIHSRKTYQYISCQNGFKVLKLPYQAQAHAKSKISMYIILPDRRDGLGDLIEKATTDSASFLNQCLGVDPPSVRTGQFKVPKFKITFGFDAKTVLEGMGLVLPFGGQAELTGMVDGHVSVSSVIHKCFIEVDEQGTEAAAATAIVGVFGCCAAPVYTPPPVDFVADHPFMFMIKDSYTGVVLFTGYVLNPLLAS